MFTVPPVNHTPLQRDAIYVNADDNYSIEQSKGGRERRSLGAASAGCRALPLVDDGQRRLLLPHVVKSLQRCLELRVPLLIRRDAINLQQAEKGPLKGCIGST